MPSTILKLWLCLVWGTKYENEAWQWPVDDKINCICTRRTRASLVAESLPRGQQDSSSSDPTLSSCCLQTVVSGPSVQQAGLDPEIENGSCRSSTYRPTDRKLLLPIQLGASSRHTRWPSYCDCSRSDFGGNCLSSLPRWQRRHELHSHGSSCDVKYTAQMDRKASWNVQARLLMGSISARSCASTSCSWSRA